MVMASNRQHNEKGIYLFRYGYGIHKSNLNEDKDDPKPVSKLNLLVSLWFQVDDIPKCNVVSPIWTSEAKHIGT